MPHLPGAYYQQTSSGKAGSEGKRGRVKVTKREKLDGESMWIMANGWSKGTVAGIWVGRSDTFVDATGFMHFGKMGMWL